MPSHIPARQVVMQKIGRALWISFLCHSNVSQSRSLITKLPTATQGPRSLAQPNGNNTQLQQRAVDADLVTCVYLRDDPDQVRTTNSGYECRIDSRNGLWGFCPTTISAATDCGLAGSCEDEHGCSKGCGMTDEDLSTTTCRGTNGYCSTILLTFDVGQTYSYIACGTKAVTNHYVVSITADTTTTTTTSFYDFSASTAPTITLTTSTTMYTSGSTSNPTQSSTILGENVRETETGSAGNEFPSSRRASPNTGAIVGGVIGGLVLVCVTVIVVVYLLRRNGTQPSSTQPQGHHESHQRFSSWRISNKPKEPLELAGWGPRELAGSLPPKLRDDNYHGREPIVELAS